MSKHTEFGIIRSLDVNLIKIYGRNFQISTVKKKIQHADDYPVRTAKPYNNILSKANLFT